MKSIATLADSIKSAYVNLLQAPVYVVIFMVMVCALATWQLRHFSFDASSDTLVVQGDPKLAFYQEMELLFGGDEFLILTVTPKGTELFTRAGLKLIEDIQQSLVEVEGVSGVFSVLDAPLLRSPPVDFESLDSAYLTLRDESVDLSLARKELTGSPFFGNYLVSGDGLTSAIKVDLKLEVELLSVTREKDQLAVRENLTAEEANRFAQLQARYAQLREVYLEGRQKLIEALRQIKAGYEPQAQIYLGGVPMIASDMVAFIKSDIVVFGLVVLAMMLVMLYVFFRQWLWVFLPLLLSMVSVLLMTGLLGFMLHPVTVISANFILLLVIVTVSFCVHLIVRYRELIANEPGYDHLALVAETMSSKFAPCLYTALTTMVAFSSMIISRILPVEDFGWMMCVGIIVSFVVTYLSFPALVMLMGSQSVSQDDDRPLGVTKILYAYATGKPWQVLSGALIIFLIAGIGLGQLSFNNRFIDYFKASTEIRQGMEYIDDNLGGTVPFEVYLQFDPWEASDDEDDFFDEEDDPYPERYWFTQEKLEQVDRMHQYINSLDQTGKVLSVATLERIGREFNDGKPLSGLQISGILGVIPQEFRGQLIDAYAHPAGGLMRINARVREQGAYFSRSQLVDEIYDWADKNLEGVEIRVSGMMVLFDDMLSRMFSSQINTLSYVVLATFVMFLLLLRSVILAVVALVPNLIAASTIIAVMGYANVPMDMMTITIAGIVIGIGVDNAIHYLHRFRAEWAASGNLQQAIAQAHSTIGKAIYYTAVVVIGGFSILSLSSFLPTVYFGLLTALAMLLALLANLIILPALLSRVYAGRERKAENLPA
ncbi:MAG: MMPL family transporter [Gammaproteobacteria bacterium]|nr:MMPL family transporter [Gammaproteobacteria bacterium]